MESGNTTSDAIATNSKQALGDDNQANILRRFLALVLDGFIAVMMSFIPNVGGSLGVIYFLLRDALPIPSLKHGSLGKKLMKLELLKDNHQPLNVFDSLKRNWPLVFGLLTDPLSLMGEAGLILVPFFVVAAVAFTMLELTLALINPDGKRLGDRLAKTTVAEVTHANT